MAGERITPTNARVLEATIGTGVSSFSAGLARVLLELDEQELTIELQIDLIYQQEKYQIYRVCFES